MPSRTRTLIVSFFLALAFAITAAPPAHAEKNGINSLKFKWDCLRYLKNSFTYNFRPFAGKINPDFIWGVPLTEVRPLSVAAEGAIYRYLESTDLSRLTAYALWEVSETWDLNPWLRNEFIKTIEKKQAFLRTNLPKNTPAPRSSSGLESELENLEFLKKKLKTFEARTQIEKRIEKINSTTPSKPDDMAIATQNNLIATLEAILIRFLPKHSEVNKIFEDTLDIVVGNERSNGLSMVVRNTGVIEHFSREVSNNPILTSDALDFYSRLYKLDHEASNGPRLKLNRHLFSNPILQ